MKKVVYDNDGNILQAFEITGDIDFQVVIPDTKCMPLRTIDLPTWQQVQASPDSHKVVTNPDGTIGVVSKA